MRLIDADKLPKYTGYALSANEVAVAVENAPTIDAVPVVHGRWIIEPDATVMHCDVCGWAFEYYGGLEEEWNNCPHCGAKMDEEGE